MIAIIDYGAGNLQSVKNALDYLKVKSIITSNANEIIKAKKVIFPGVGSFGDGIRALNELDLIDPIMKAIEDNKPFLGICLGMQVLFEKSEESPGVEGLGIFEGTVKKFKGDLKIPQIGWNNVNLIKQSKLFKDIPDNSFFSNPSAILFSFLLTNKAPSPLTASLIKKLVLFLSSKVVG